MKVVRKVFDAQGPVFCEVELDSDYSFMPKLSSKKLETGEIVSPNIEDMWPFLERKEFLKHVIDG